jgi:hypothetical protein
VSRVLKLQELQYPEMNEGKTTQRISIIGSRKTLIVSCRILTSALNQQLHDLFHGHHQPEKHSPTQRTVMWPQELALCEYISQKSSVLQESPTNAAEYSPCCQKDQNQHQDRKASSGRMCDYATPQFDVDKRTRTSSSFPFNAAI